MIDVLDVAEGQRTLNLFPTENRMSRRARRALATDAVHRYPTSEGPDYFYGDVGGLAAVYERASSLARTYFDARHAYVPFLSGLHTMHCVLTALCTPGCRVAVMDPTCGGHYATSTICERYGYEVSLLPFDRESCLIDIDAIVRSDRLSSVDLVYLDVSTVLRFPRIDALRAAFPRAQICLDASHILGILPASPYGTGLDAGLTSCSGSTHKSFPGPQKGVFVTNDDDCAGAIEAHLPFVVSSGHSNSVAALAITLEELLPHREVYAAAVVENARALGEALIAQGFDVAGAAFGFSETHQVWVLPSAGMPPTFWGKRLMQAGVRSTTVTLPHAGRPGLRLGTQELTRTGMSPAEMDDVAELLYRILLSEEDAASMRRVVEEFVSAFQDVQFVGPAPTKTAAARGVVP